MTTATIFQTHRVQALVMATILLTACGGAGGGSAGNTPDPASVSPNAYLGVLSVAGSSDLGGTLLLSPVQGTTAATGTLVTSTGSPVALSGTYGGSGFNVAGGGYAIVAAVGGGGLTGTGTAPGGQQATVSAPPGPTVSAPPPADPSGTYKGTFRIETIGLFKNTLANGNVSINCTNSVVIAGSLTMDVQNKGGGQISAHLVAATVDTTTPATCPGTQVGSVSIPFSGLDFQGSATGLQLGRVNSGPGGSDGKGFITRIEAFSGAISGTSIVGTVWRSFNFTTPIGTSGETHVEGYPMSSVAVTLTRQ